MEKVVLVTGSSRGIGAATALLLAKQGYHIVVNFKSNKRAAQEVVDKVLALGVSAVAIQADISIEEEVLELFASIDTQFGSLTHLVNNAGILRAQSKLVDFSVERIQQVLATNVLGTMLCCREAIKRLSIEQGGKGGAIVNVSSAAAKLGSPNEYIDYAASKGAIDTLTIGLAAEVADQGIRVNGVRPGLIYTEMHADSGEPNRVDRLKQSLPLKRGGTAEEVANAIAWLLSNESSYTTGSMIDVAGGR